jgi:hypothetical protein
MDGGVHLVLGFGEIPRLGDRPPRIYTMQFRILCLYTPAIPSRAILSLDREQ